MLCPLFHSVRSEPPGVRGGSSSFSPTPAQSRGKGQMPPCQEACHGAGEVTCLPARPAMQAAGRSFTRNTTDQKNGNEMKALVQVLGYHPWGGPEPTGPCRCFSHKPLIHLLLLLLLPSQAVRVERDLPTALPEPPRGGENRLPSLGRCVNRMPKMPATSLSQEACLFLWWSN